MAQINLLTSISKLSAGDLLPVWVSNKSDNFKVAISTVLQYMQNNLVFPSNKAFVQKAFPEDGDTIVMTDGADDNQDIHVLMSPSGFGPTVNIIFPPKASLVDKQTFLFTTDATSIGTLEVESNGTNVDSLPSSLGVFGFVKIKYDLVSETWTRIG